MARDSDTPRTPRLETETHSFESQWASETTPLVPAFTILCHPDPDRIGERATLTHLASGRDVELSRLEPDFAHPGHSFAPPRPLADVHLSRRPIRVVPATAPGELRLIPAQESVSAITVGGEPLTLPYMVSRDDLEGGVTLMLSQRIVLLLHLADPAPPTGLDPLGLVGESAPIVALRQKIRRVADLPVPVLLRGPTGSGKELAARALHRIGPRARAPFVSVNMAAIPTALAAAELFGAVKGAYTGAERPRAGYFVRADGGTLFLDEIGEIPPDLQALLLRALDTGEVQPVGAERSSRVDVRLIAATDADLEKGVAEEGFKAPLLHRLSGYVVELPPLSARRDDLGRLLYFFLRQELEAIGQLQCLEAPKAGAEPWLPAPLVERLARSDWPGNVRQLRNVARELVIEGRDAERTRAGPQTERLLSRLPTQPEPRGGESGSDGRRYRRPSEVSEDELIATLRAHRWQLRPAAAEMGLSRTSLYALVEANPRLRTAADLSAEEVRRAFEHLEGDLEAMADRLQVSAPGLRRRLTELGLG